MKHFKKCSYSFAKANLFFIDFKMNAVKWLARRTLLVKLVSVKIQKFPTCLEYYFIQSHMMTRNTITFALRRWFHVVWMHFPDLVPVSSSSGSECVASGQQHKSPRSVRSIFGLHLADTDESVYLTESDTLWWIPALGVSQTHPVILMHTDIWEPSADSAEEHQCMWAS